MDDEDGDFSLNTATRTRLSSLFQGDNSSGDVNQALTFTAPKQPRKNENPQNSSETCKLLTAAVVHAYKLKDGSYANQGKLGCAILELQENSSYKFLLYKGKQIQVTACSIIPSFKFHIQPNNFVNFFDDKNENWSINFESEVAITEFAKQVALAKFNSEGKNKSLLVVQDLVLGEGPSLENGDAAEVRYSVWSFSNYSFGQLLGSNVKSESSFRFRLGKSKIIKGLSDGLVGAQKGTKRLLIIPPNLVTEGTTPSVPPNTAVIFEVIVIKVKVSRESSNSPNPIKIPETASEKKPELLPRPSVSQEDNIRLRGASISEQLSQSPKKDKAQIISRMAKMGTATLPFQGAIAAHVSSDSENEEEIEAEELITHPSSSRTASPKSYSKPNSRKNSGSSVISQPVQVIPENVALQVTQQSSQVALSSQVSLPTHQAFASPNPTMSFSTYQTAFPAQFPMPGLIPTNMADAHLPLLMTETRNQNTEVRLSLSKITDKVDTVIQKVDELRLLPGRGISQAPFMDSSMLIQNIERIVQENKQLKEDVEAKNSKIQSLNEKICDLFQRNQRFFEESNNMLERRSDSMQAVSAQSQAKLISLENEKAKLSSDFLDATSKLAVMEGELNKIRSQENHLKQMLQKYEEKMEKESKDNDLEKESLVISLQQKVKSAEDEAEKLSKKLSDLELQYEQLSESKIALEKLLVEYESKVDEFKSRIEKDLKISHDNEIRMYQEKIKQLSEKDDSVDVSETLLRKENEKLMKEKEEMESLLQKIQKELKISEVAVEEQEKKLHELQSVHDSSLTWKKKYDVFYERTRAMKEKYETQMGELAAEVEHLKSSGSTPVSSNFSEKIKKVMNALFKILQGKFDQNSSYQGAKVLEITLQSIRVLAFQMLEMKNKTSTTISENDTESETNSSELQESCLESSANSSESPVPQNGLAETETSKTLSFDHKSADESPKRLEAESKEETQNEQSESEHNVVEKNSDDSKLTENSDTPNVEEPKIIPKETTEVNRASPDNSQLLSLKNDVLSDSGASKVLDGLF